MKKLLLPLLFVVALSAQNNSNCWYPTPFGPAWICTNQPMPSPNVSPVVPPPTPVPFVPTFQMNVTLASPFSTIPYPLNHDYFATLATANEVCSLLSCTFVSSQTPCDMGGGSFTCSGIEYMLNFMGIVPINAGLLASNWERNPESQFPGVALTLAKMAVAAAPKTSGNTVLDLIKTPPIATTK